MVYILYKFPYNPFQKIRIQPNLFSSFIKRKKERKKSSKRGRLRMLPLPIESRPFPKESIYKFSQLFGVFFFPCVTHMSVLHLSPLHYKLTLHYLSSVPLLLQRRLMWEKKTETVKEELEKEKKIIREREREREKEGGRIQKRLINKTKDL